MLDPVFYLKRGLIMKKNCSNNESQEISHETKLNILRPGFQHPQSKQNTLPEDQSKKNESLNMSHRACTWDAL